MGHGTSNLSRRESNAKLIATYSASPAENDDDSTGTFSSLSKFILFSIVASSIQQRHYFLSLQMLAT